MKMKYLLLLPVAVFCLSCESKIVEVEKNKLFAEVFVWVSPRYFDTDSNKYIDKENMNFSGTLIGESVTAINSIFIGEESVPYENIYRGRNIEYGSINFKNASTLFIENDDYKKFIINNSLGKLEGIIKIPDSIYNVEYSLSDTVRSDENLEINFNGNADYYILSYVVAYQIPPDTLYYHYLEKKLVSVTTKFVIDLTQFSNSRYLVVNSIQAFNGPLPEKGTNGNMSGDGSGFLYSLKRKVLSNHLIIMK